MFLVSEPFTIITVCDGTWTDPMAINRVLSQAWDWTSGDMMVRHTPFLGGDKIVAKWCADMNVAVDESWRAGVDVTRPRLVVPAMLAAGGDVCFGFVRARGSRAAKAVALAQSLGVPSLFTSWDDVDPPMVALFERVRLWGLHE